MEDNHCKNKEKPSPFYKVVDLIKDFAMEPMHTLYGGAVDRWLNGLVNERKEGNVCAKMKTRKLINNLAL